MRAQLTAGTKFYFVPDAIGTKSFCPRQMGQNSFVPGTDFCPRYHNLGLGTKYVFLHVGWVQNLNLFSVVFLLFSTRATWDSGIKILV